jgi:hypothetical protein
MSEEPSKEESRETTPRKALDPWDREARRVLRLEMLRADHTPESLAVLLKHAGYGANTEKALAQRIVRGSFNFGFALRVLSAMGVKTLDLSHLKVQVKTKPPEPPKSGGL